MVISCYVKIANPLQIKVIHLVCLLVQLSEGCKDYFIKARVRKGSYTTKGNTAQQISWKENSNLDPRSRQRELDDIRLEQERAQSRTRKDTWASN